jgi:hypothetical protein
MYCELPDIPPYMRGGRFGSRSRQERSSHETDSVRWLKCVPIVGRLPANILVGKLGVLVMVTDRCLFECEWNMHTSAVWGSRPEHTPMRAGAPELDKWNGPATDRDTVD